MKNLCRHIHSTFKHDVDVEEATPSLASGVLIPPGAGTTPNGITTCESQRISKACERLFFSNADVPDNADNCPIAVLYFRARVGKIYESISRPMRFSIARH